MKTYKEFISDLEHSESTVELEESFIRKGASTAYAASAKKHGDNAEKHFTIGAGYLRGTAAKDLEDRIENLERSCSEALLGLISMRKQIGSNTAILLTTALFAEKNDDRLKRNK